MIDVCKFKEWDEVTPLFLLIYVLRSPFHKKERLKKIGNLMVTGKRPTLIEGNAELRLHQCFIVLVRCHTSGILILYFSMAEKIDYLSRFKGFRCRDQTDVGAC